MRQCSPLQQRDRGRKNLQVRQRQSKALAGVKNSMSSQQPVTNSDGAHPPVPVKLSNQEQQRVQQADSKLQNYVKESNVQVRITKLPSIIASYQQRVLLDPGDLER